MLIEQYLNIKEFLQKTADRRNLFVVYLGAFGILENAKSESKCISQQPEFGDSICANLESPPMSS